MFEGMAGFQEVDGKYHEIQFGFDISQSDSFSVRLGNLKYKV